MQNLYTQEIGIILSNTIEKSTVAFSCYTQFLDIDKKQLYGHFRDQNHKMDQ